MPKKKGRPDAKTPAIKELRRFLDEHGVSISAAARFLTMSHVAVLSWFAGATRPDCARRKMIAKWTRGRVPEDVWLSPEELKSIAEQKPFSGGKAA